MIKEINFDMDGTLNMMYDVPNWLKSLQDEDTRPYDIALPAVDIVDFTTNILRLQANGYKVNIISWLSKCGSEKFNEAVTASKIKWLRRTFPEIWWDEIHIVPYGTPKQTLGKGILFDDELQNRLNWHGLAFGVDNINEIIRLIK